MTIATDPTFFDPATLQTFSLHGAGGALLVALPPTVGLPNQLGQPDPYTWDRPPGSAAWFPLGDGLPNQRPTTVLSGEWLYASLDEALAALNAIQTAMPAARELHWCGVKIADLHATYPGSYQPQHLYPARHVRHTLTLNTGAALTPTDLSGVIGNNGSPTLPPVGTGVPQWSELAWT